MQHRLCRCSSSSGRCLHIFRIQAHSSAPSSAPSFLNFFFHFTLFAALSRWPIHSHCLIAHLMELCIGNGASDRPQMLPTMVSTANVAAQHRNTTKLALSLAAWHFLLLSRAISLQSCMSSVSGKSVPWQIALGHANVSVGVLVCLSVHSN